MAKKYTLNEWKIEYTENLHTRKATVANRFLIHCKAIEAGFTPDEIVAYAVQNGVLAESTKRSEKSKIKLCADATVKVVQKCADVLEKSAVIMNDGQFTRWLRLCRDGEGKPDKGTLESVVQKGITHSKLNKGKVEQRLKNLLDKATKDMGAKRASTAFQAWFTETFAEADA